MGSTVLGIDLGTTNSAVAVASGQGVRVLRDPQGDALVPSVVSFHPSGDILVGKSARERRLLDAANTVYSVKRLIGRPFDSEEVRQARARFPFELRGSPTGGVLVSARGEDYSLSEVSAFVLRQVRAQAELAFDEACERAVITVPASFNELQRSATKAAGKVAGLDVARILNEPTAAALAYGYGRGTRERVAVYDFGGGTFDLTILDLAGDVFEVLATAGDTYLGGDDIDTAVAGEMANLFLQHHRYDPRENAQAFERLRVAAEWAKCRLSEREDVQVRVEELAYGRGGEPLDLAFTLRRDALERLARPLTARTFDVCEEAMRLAGLRPTQLDNVILVGGSTRVPMVRQMVGEYFGREPLSRIDPELVVAKGAAIQGHALSGQRRKRTTSLGRVKLRRSEAEAASGRSSPPAGMTAGDPESEEETLPRSPWSNAPRPASLPPATSTLAADGEARQPADGSEAGPPSPSAAQASHGLADSAASLRAPRVPSVDAPTPSGSAPSGSAPSGSALSGSALSGSAPPGPAPDGPGAAAKGPGGSGAPSLPAASVPPPPGGPTAWGEPGRPGLPEPPLLLDVTPLSLSVETVGGYCERIIARNAAIPVEQMRTFTTARDGQQVVRVQICQGESRRLDENQRLGAIELQGLRSAARGQIKIGVTFMISADGMLDVRARDLETGREQGVRINLIGGVSDAEVERMRGRHAALFAQRAEGPSA